MKANELRIGNLIQIFHKSKGWILHYASADTIASFKPEFVKPIEINKDWLLILGFKFIDGRNYKLKNFGTYSFHFGKACFYPAGLLNSLQRMDNVQYVHQLQNLYFAIWNEELTVHI
jgi:hypothetical protein